MRSAFIDKTMAPAEPDVKQALGSTYRLWKELADHAMAAQPDAAKTWHFSGAKQGWSCRISDKKRVLLYLLPLENAFKAAFVFGQKASDEILGSAVTDSIKNLLREAKVYGEGRGIRIDVKNGALLGDLKKLVDIKIGN